MPGPRGPSGAAPSPPPWLVTANLPIQSVHAGTTLYRVHRELRDPVFFGPGAGTAPTYRFDSLSGAFGVLYVGLGMGGAVVDYVQMPSFETVRDAEVYYALSPMR